MVENWFWANYKKMEKENYIKKVKKKKKKE